MFSVQIFTPREVLFEGKTESAIFPGEMGVFEVLSFHKPLLSRLVGGSIIIGPYEFVIRRGVMQVKNNKVIVIIEKT